MDYVLNSLIYVSVSACYALIWLVYDPASVGYVLYYLFIFLPQWGAFWTHFVMVLLQWVTFYFVPFHTHTHTPYVSVKYNYSIRGWGGVGGIRCIGPGYVLFKDWIASPSSRNITQSFNIQYTVFKLKLRVVFIRRKDFEKMGFDLPLSIYKVKSQYRNLFFPNCLSGFVLDSSRR